MGTTRRPGRASAAALALTLLAALALAGCGGDDGAAADEDNPASPSSSTASASPSPTPSGDSPSGAPSTEATAEGPVLPVRVRGDSVEPRGKRVQVAVGEPVTFVIDSDGPGELHVHATPEAEIAFSAGRSREELVIDRPGVVDVELHEPTEVTVFQLEVR